MMTNITLRQSLYSYDEYAKNTYLASIHKKGLNQPVGTPTDEDLKLMYDRFEAYTKSNYEVYENYLEEIIDSYQDLNLEVHKTTLLINKDTGEVISDDFFIVDKAYVTKKKKELNSLKYYKDKVSKSRPKSGVKVSGYKSNHRYTKVFSKVRPEFKSHKNLGIFYDITRELSPFENVVSAQRNNGTFTPLSTKEIQEKFNISVDDIKSFKSEAKRLKLIADVKLEGRAVGIRVNPAYAMNGQSFSNDVFESFQDAPEFTQSISEDV